MFFFSHIFRSNMDNPSDTECISNMIGMTISVQKKLADNAKRKLNDLSKMLADATSSTTSALELVQKTIAKQASGEPNNMLNIVRIVMDAIQACNEHDSMRQFMLLDDTKINVTVSRFVHEYLGRCNMCDIVAANLPYAFGCCSCPICEACAKCYATYVEKGRKEKTAFQCPVCKDADISDTLSGTTRISEKAMSLVTLVNQHE